MEVTAWSPWKGAGKWTWHCSMQGRRDELDPPLVLELRPRVLFVQLERATPLLKDSEPRYQAGGAGTALGISQGRVSFWDAPAVLNTSKHQLTPPDAVGTPSLIEHTPLGSSPTDFPSKPARPGVFRAPGAGQEEKLPAQPLTAAMAQQRQPGDNKAEISSFEGGEGQTID